MTGCYLADGQRIGLPQGHIAPYKTCRKWFISLVTPMFMFFLLIMTYISRLGLRPRRCPDGVRSWQSTALLFFYRLISPLYCCLRPHCDASLAERELLHPWSRAVFVQHNASQTPTCKTIVPFRAESVPSPIHSRASETTWYDAVSSKHVSNADFQTLYRTKDVNKSRGFLNVNFSRST